MTAEITQPPFALYIVWHPKYIEGKKIATQLHNHFGTNGYCNINGNTGIPVLFRNTNAPNSSTPLGIDLNSADSIAIIILSDHALKNDYAWMQYVQGLVDDTATKGLGMQVFPISIQPGTHNVVKKIHALRWDKCVDKNLTLEKWLIINITILLIRILRYCLERILYPDRSDPTKNYMENVNVFLSHSKHDCDGKTVAKAIREWLHNNIQMSSFYDTHDIIPGLSFDVAINQSIKDGVMVIIYTDSYSSRDWCRREVITAKSENVPLLAVDCLRDVDERSFPYMGNVPVVRMNSVTDDRIPRVVEKLLDEVFKDLLWRYTVKKHYKPSSHIIFLSRPPELFSLTALPRSTNDKTQLIVYPDPPLSNVELELLLKIGHNIKLLNMKKWQTEMNK